METTINFNPKTTDYISILRDQGKNRAFVLDKIGCKLDMFNLDPQVNDVEEEVVGLGGYTGNREFTLTKGHVIEDSEDVKFGGTTTTYPYTIDYNTGEIVFDERYAPPVGTTLEVDFTHTNYTTVTNNDVHLDPASDGKLFRLHETEAVPFIPGTLEVSVHDGTDWVVQPHGEGVYSYNNFTGIILFAEAPDATVRAIYDAYTQTTVTNEALGTGSSVGTLVYQLANTNLVPDSETMTSDGNPLTSPADYTLNAETGVVTFVNLPLATEEVLIDYTRYLLEEQEDVGTGNGALVEFALGNTDVKEDSETVWVSKGADPDPNDPDDWDLMTKGAMEDYTIVYATGVITFNEAPGDTLKIMATYEYEDDVNAEEIETDGVLNHEFGPTAETPIVIGSETLEVADGIGGWDAQVEGSEEDYTIDYNTGEIEFVEGKEPPVGRAVRVTYKHYDTTTTVTDEVPTGDKDGVLISVFNLAHTLVTPRSEAIKVNEVERTRGTHYTINNITGVITFEDDHRPTLEQEVVADYSFNNWENPITTLVKSVGSRGKGDDQFNLRNPYGNWAIPFMLYVPDDNTTATENEKIGEIADDNDSKVLTFSIDAQVKVGSVSIVVKNNNGTTHSTYVDKSEGLLFVADQDEEEVFGEINYYNGEVTLHFATALTGEVRDVEATYVELEEYLFISDSYNGRVKMLDLDGNVVQIFGSDKLSNPAGLAMDSDGKLHVVDVLESRVVVFKPNVGTGLFEYDRTYGTRGSTTGGGIGKLRNPHDIYIDTADDTVYITDVSNGRIVMFDKSGANFVPADPYAIINGFTDPITELADKKLRGPISMSLVKDGSDVFLYVADFYHPNVVKFDITDPSTVTKEAVFLSYDPDDYRPVDTKAYNRVRSVYATTTHLTFVNIGKGKIIIKDLV